MINSKINKKVNYNPPITKVLIGKAWAINTVNTIIFRHHGLITRGNHQYTSYYDEDGNIIIIHRNINDNKINSYKIEGKFNPLDAHNSLSFGIDPKGFLHICYDEHASKLKYRRSLSPYSINYWTEELSMTDTLENLVTYPTFLMKPKEEMDKEGKGELLFLYRYGWCGNGDAVLKSYNCDTSTWIDKAVRFLKGMDSKPWTCNPYWNNPVFDSHGNLYLTYTWRWEKNISSNLVNNSDICYMMTTNNGLDWYTSLGKQLKLPVTPTDDEVIKNISGDQNLINQTGCDIDSEGNIHVVYYANDKKGVPQYWHLWFHDGKWNSSIISNRKDIFQLEGGGTLQIPISRPQIIIDKQDNVYIIYRGDLTEDKMAVQKLKAPDYKPEGNVSILYNRQLGYAEPIVDRVRWKRDGILSMLIQKNNQPNHDISEDSEKYVEDIYIMEWNIN